MIRSQVRRIREELRGHSAWEWLGAALVALALALLTITTVAQPLQLGLAKILGLVR